MARNSGDYSESKIPTMNTEEVSEANSGYVICVAKDAKIGSTDAKMGKRNNANKKSVASSKERKKRYIVALERAVQRLQTESTSLYAQLNLLVEDTNGLSSKNSELKLLMQSMENEVHLQDAPNKALKKEIQQLTAMVRQSIQNGAPTLSFPWSIGAGQQFQLQAPQLNQFQQQKQEAGDFDTWAAIPSPSHTDTSSDTSPSRDTVTVSYSDYHLF